MCVCVCVCVCVFLIFKNTQDELLLNTSELIQQ